ncbi:cation diffusion facilitator family transporter [Paenimyroides baculatum]|uniref:Cation transporter n=1 Tax=Paenimyroides baculatum TaxID=2608000 RepID=A0A5M6CT17_9FLAO|nr:cation diffusion facilitator family transporter [Paenimyroides baculatum]KAA5538387.1 cation transporter [Paenimyroides baculatum]
MKTGNKTNKQLSLAFFLNLFFAVIELVGGILTNSTAIIADAFHDFMDAVAIGIAVYMDKFSKKPASLTFTYGYRRFALLSAIIMSAILLVGAAFMLYNGFIFINKPREINSLGMLGLAVLGITVNGFAFLRIKKGNEHEHHHAHTSHDANSKAIMLHLLEDVLGWIAVLLGAIVMYFTNWYWIDSVLTIAIALFIAYNALRNLYDTFAVLLQAVPKEIDLQKLTTELSQINHITKINDLKVWSMDGQQHIATLKIQVNTANVEELIVLNEQLHTLLNNYKVTDITLQIDNDI